MFWASPFKKLGYRLGFKLHVMWVITGEKIVPSIVKTKVSNSSFARNHIYLTFKYCGLILSSLTFRPVRLDTRENNRKISGKTWHTRRKIYSTVDWNKRPLFPKGTFRSMELLMSWQFSFSAACTCSILHQKWNRIQCFPLLSVSSKWLKCLVRSQCHVNPHAYHGCIFWNIPKRWRNYSMHLYWISPSCQSLLVRIGLDRSKQTKTPRKLIEGESCHSIA